MTKRRFTVYDMAVVGLMAAAVFVATNFRIEFPTPVGKSMIHLGNIVCLLSGLLFGPLRGGLAAGFGSCIFDIFGGWADSAPFTLVFKFIMGLLCGFISGGGQEHPPTAARGILGAACGMYGYVLLYLSKTFVGDLLLGSAVETALSDVGVKAVSSTINGTLAIVLSCLLAPMLRATLEKAGVMAKLRRA